MTTDTERTMSARGQRLAAGASLLVPLVAVVVSWLVWRSDLPATIAFHWDARGRVDGTVPTEPILAVALVGAGIGLVAGVAALTIRRVPARDRRTYVFWSGCVAGTAAAAWLVPAGLTHAAGAAETATLDGWMPALVALIGYGLVPYLITRGEERH